LADEVQRGPGATVDFTRVAPFAWDRLYVFGPYTPPEQIHASLGFHWGGVEGTSIQESDGVNLVVFVKDGQVVHWFEHPRHRGELEAVADPRGYAREEAQFQVCLVGAEQRLALAKPAK
jgi:hypothetical protein